MIIYEKRGRFIFKNKEGRDCKFNTLQEAIDAGGTEPRVAVSGVPYKVNTSNIKLPAYSAEDLGDK